MQNGRRNIKQGIISSVIICLLPFIEIVFRFNDQLWPKVKMCLHVSIAVLNLPNGWVNVLLVKAGIPL